MLCRLFAVLVLLAVSIGGGHAHFLFVKPSTDVLVTGGNVRLDMTFTHPMDRGPVMELKRPKRFGVIIGGERRDLTAKLKQRLVLGKSSWTLTQSLKRPGTAIYYVEPQPYWEAAERKYIIQYAKVIVDSFATGVGWDRLVGLPVEIRPLTRPSGLWTGNLFRGVVLRSGKPVPYATIEVEWANDGSIKPPNAAFVTQAIKADATGTFSYAMPRAGWWGFAAIIDSDQSMKAPDGQPATVEIGAVMWVKATDMRPGR